MQKLVTIYLDNTAYGNPKVTGCYADKHAYVEEHLQEYLTEGWQVRSLYGLGGSSGLCLPGLGRCRVGKGQVNLKRSGSILRCNKSAERDIAADQSRHIG